MDSPELASALRLKAQGWEVTVCEAGPTFGGKMNRWPQGGYWFDTGPSLITMPHIFEELYGSLGERMEEHVSLMRLDPHAEYRFDCGARIVCPAGIEEWKETIREVEPRDVRGFETLHSLGRHLYELRCEPSSAGARRRALRSRNLRPSDFCRCAADGETTSGPSRVS